MGAAVCEEIHKIALSDLNIDQTKTDFCREILKRAILGIKWEMVAKVFRPKPFLMGFVLGQLTKFRVKIFLK